MKAEYYPSPVDIIERHENEIELDDVLCTLTPREKKAIILRFWKGNTYQKIGKNFKITLSGARQVVNKAINKLKHPTRCCRLKSVMNCK